MIPALIREIEEEAGVTYFAHQVITKIGVTEYLRKDKPENNIRHYFKLDGSHLPEKWSHTVKSDGEDNALVFEFFWQEIASAKESLTGNFGELLNLV